MTGLSKQFEEYLLRDLYVSRKTLRNYRCDIAHFVNFALAQTSTNNIEELLPHFTFELVNNYKNSQKLEGTPTSTINRRLSTLRNFARFLSEKGLIASNPTEIVENIQKTATLEQKLEKMLDEFKKHLEEQGVSKSTLKNYLSDVNQFFQYAIANDKGGR